MNQESAYFFVTNWGWNYYNPGNSPEHTCRILAQLEALSFRSLRLVITTYSRNSPR